MALPKPRWRDPVFWSMALRLALPVAIQNLLISSFALVDTLMVGQLGDIPLSAIGMATQWAWLLNICQFGFCSGATLFYAQYWGVKDVKGIHRVFGIAMSLVMVLSLVFTAICVGAPAWAMTLFNRTPEVVAQGAAYLRIAGWSYVAQMAVSMIGALLRSTGRVQLPMVTACLTTVLNIGLDYAMIFGKWGFPAMGIEGAAWATAISAWVGLLFVVVVSVVQKNILMGPIREFFAFDRPMLREYFQKANPVVVNEVAWGMGTVALNLIYSNLGYEYYAAVTIVRTFENLAFALLIGLCSACAIMVGNSVGAGDIRQGVEQSRRFMVAQPAAAGILGLVLIALREPLLHLFNTGGALSEVTYTSAIYILIIYSAHMTIRNIPYVAIVGIYRAGGDTATGVKYDMGCLWFLSIPVTFLAAYVFHLPFPVVYILMLVSEDYLKTALCIRHFRSWRWLMPVTQEGREALTAWKTKYDIA
ncbi:MAG: MATE family efflux transporter [Ruminiclostridium sp.]|nr:MATE family efflux transporter [Ruminiclostridium sp.]